MILRLMLRHDKNDEFSLYRWRMKRFRSVFCGNELVDWLILVGLAHDRGEAIKYGRHLLLGRIIRHVDNEHHFFDLAYFYSFIPLENAL